MNPDPYGLIHRALRFMLARLAEEVATTDWSRAERAAATGAAIERALALLDEHASLETRFLTPVIAHVAPELRAAIDADHAALAALHHALRDEATLTRDGGPDGALVTRHLHAVIEAEFGHMRREEREVLPRLRAALGDAELAAIEASIRAAVAPRRRREILELMEQIA